MGKVIFPGTAHNTRLLDGFPSEYFRLGQNFITNPLFHFNQRGQNTYAAAGYTVDRWRWTGAQNSSVTVAENTVLSGNSGTTSFLLQPVELAFGKNLFGQAVTISLRYRCTSANCAIYIGIPAADTYHTVVSIPLVPDALERVAAGTAVIPNVTNATAFELYGIRHGGQGALTLLHAHVEIGVISSIEPLSGYRNKLLGCEPYQRQEFAKCQRYYQVHPNGNIPADTLSPPMRKNPTVTQRPDGLWAYDAEL